MVFDRNSVLIILSIFILMVHISECCPSNIPVKWRFVPPYIHKDGDSGRMQGILPTIFGKMVHSCCGNTTKISYNNPAKSQREMFSPSKSESYIGFPIYGSMLQNKIGQNPYLPIIESPGIIYLIDKSKDLQSTVENGVLNSLKSALTTMGFICLAAAVSGNVIWALDCYRNPHQFPVQYFKGSWDGFWWACVTMTTVGYGDRAPKSYCGRIFASFWVLLGLAVLAVFYAGVTTSLTSLILTGNPLYAGEKVVVISETAEKYVGMTNNVKMSDVANAKALRDSLKEDSSVKGALLDAYVAGYYSEMFSPDNGFHVADIIDKTPAYGLIMHGPISEDVKMKKCFLRYLSLSQEDVVKTIQQFTNNIKIPNRSISQERSLMLFDYRHEWYIIATSSCVVVIILNILFVFVWRQCRQRKEDKINKKANEQKIQDIISIEEPKEETMEELLRRQCKELETAMADEVERFMTSWIKQKRRVIQQYA